MTLVELIMVRKGTLSLLTCSDPDGFATICLVKWGFVSAKHFLENLDQSLVLAYQLLFQGSTLETHIYRLDGPVDRKLYSCLIVFVFFLRNTWFRIFRFEMLSFCLVNTV